MAAARDGHAFARLVRLHGEAMTRVAWLVTGEMPAAVSAVRAALVAAWTGIRQPHAPADIEPWLCRLATVEAERLVPLAVEGVLPPGSPAWTGESSISLGVLVPADRSLLALHHLAGLTAEELDTILGRRAGTAAQRLAAAWAAIGEDVVSAPFRIAALAAVPVRPIDADAIARVARAEEQEVPLRIVGVVVGVVAGAIVMLVPLLAGLAAVSP